MLFTPYFTFSNGFQKAYNRPHNLSPSLTSATSSPSLTAYVHDPPPSFLPLSMSIILSLWVGESVFLKSIFSFPASSALLPAL